jgi:hypothetical protein
MQFTCRQAHEDHTARTDGSSHGGLEATANCKRGLRVNLTLPAHELLIHHYVSPDETTPVKHRGQDVSQLTPEEWAATLVSAVCDVPGGPWFVSLGVVVDPPVQLGPYQNPAVAQEDTVKVRKYLVAVLQAAATLPADGEEDRGEHQ